MVVQGVAGIVVFTAASALMVAVVPRDRAQRFLGVGLVGGLGVAVALVFLMESVFGFWDFRGADIRILGVPAFLTLAWIPIVITYSHWLTESRSTVAAAASLLAFPLAAVATHLALLRLDLLAYNSWTLVMTFTISLGIHLAIGAYLHATGQLPNLRGIT